MGKGVEDISRKDVIWNYIATFFKIGSGLILLPFILKMMPTETVGIWTIFTTITTLIALLDLGFNQLKADKIYAYADVDHQSSNHILTKLGFENKGAFLDNGDNCYWYELEKNNRK